MGWYKTAKPSHVGCISFFVSLWLFKIYLSPPSFLGFSNSGPYTLWHINLALWCSLSFSSSTLYCTFLFGALLLHIGALFLQKYSAEYFPLETMTGRLVLHELINVCVCFLFLRKVGPRERISKTFLVTVRWQPGMSLSCGRDCAEIHNFL